MTEMLFQPMFQDYDGEDFSDLIGDEWNEIELEENEDGVFMFV